MGREKIIKLGEAVETYVGFDRLTVSRLKGSDDLWESNYIGSGY